MRFPLFKKSNFNIWGNVPERYLIGIPRFYVNVYTLNYPIDVLELLPAESFIRYGEFTLEEFSSPDQAIAYIKENSNYDNRMIFRPEISGFSDSDIRDAIKSGFGKEVPLSDLWQFQIPWNEEESKYYAIPINYVSLAWLYENNEFKLRPNKFISTAGNSYYQVSPSTLNFLGTDHGIFPVSI